MTATLSLPALRRRLAIAHQLLARPQQPQPQLLPVTITDVQSPERPAAPIQGPECSAHSPVRMVRLDELLVDPSTYQFRISKAGLFGTDGRLAAACKWNPVFAGALLVWCQPDGCLALVDGHHRYRLAHENGIEMVAVLEIEAASPQEARQLGAAANLAAGTARSADIAKLLRDGGVTAQEIVQRYGVGRNSKTLRDGETLQRLSDYLFGMVATEEIPLAIGLALATTSDRGLQHHVWSLAQKRRWDAGQVAEAIALAALAPHHQAAQTPGLPGLDDLLAESNPGVDLDAVLSVRSAIRSQLMVEQRALKTAACRRARTALEVRGVAAIDAEAATIARAEAVTSTTAFRQLAGTSGPLAELIKELAALLSDEMSAAAVVEQNLSRIHAVLSAELS